MNIYEVLPIGERIKGNPYVGRGIVIGKTADGTKSAIAYFIMGRSENSRNRVFTYKNDVLFLYRGTTLNSYSAEGIKDIALTSADWIVKYQQDDGRFLYYYDAKEDIYTFSIKVTNTGDVAGKDAVQLYLQKPYTQ